MLAWGMSSDGTARANPVPVPRPAANEVLIRVRAVAVPEAVRVDAAGMAGEILLAGSHRWSRGDRVVVLATERVRPGGFAEFAALPDDDLFRLPEGISFVTAAGIGPAFSRAWAALITEAQLDRGARVVILGGASPAAAAALQIARWKGARVVAVADGRHARRLTALGADRVVSHSAPDPVERITAAFDGERETLTVVAGTEYGRWIATGGPVVSIGDPPDGDPDALRHIFKLVGEGTLVPVIGAIFPWSEAAAAIARAGDQTNLGAVVLVPESALE